MKALLINQFCLACRSIHRILYEQRVTMKAGRARQMSASSVLVPRSVGSDSRNLSKYRNIDPSFGDYFEDV